MAKLTRGTEEEEANKTKRLLQR